MDSTATNPWPDDDVILYDGVCVFCSRWIRFVAARDTNRRFRFTAIQSAYGTRLAQAFGIDPDDPDTNAVIPRGVAWLKSDGTLTVQSSLPGWRWRRRSAMWLLRQRTSAQRQALRARRVSRRGRAARANRSRGRKGHAPSAIPTAVSVCGGNHCRGM